MVLYWSHCYNKNFSPKYFCKQRRHKKGWFHVQFSSFSFRLLLRQTAKMKLCRHSSAVCTVEWNYLYFQWIVGPLFHFCVLYYILDPDWKCLHLARKIQGPRSKVKSGRAENWNNFFILKIEKRNKIMVFDWGGGRKKVVGPQPYQPHPLRGPWKYARVRKLSYVQRQIETNIRA